MKVSAGLILTDCNSFLVGRTYQKRLDIPKGKVEEGETAEEAMIRELKEETGLNFDSLCLGENYEEFYDMGELKYIPGKNLHLFVLIVNDLPKLSTLSCNTYFEVSERKVPEFIGYEYMKWAEVENNIVLGKNQKKVLSYVKNKLGV